MCFVLLYITSYYYMYYFISVMQYISCNKLNFLYYIIVVKIDIFHFLAVIFCFFAIKLLIDLRILV